MLLFAQQTSNRLQYITGFAGKQITGGAITVTNNQQEFISYGGAKINYSDKRVSENEIWIKPHSLLFETGIKKQEINCLGTKGQKAFFQTNGDFPFDIFASSFYLLSRYEEYLPYEKDGYGRYDYKNALAYREEFLNLPLVNIWTEDFKKLLRAKFPDFRLPISDFCFLPTYDIDEAFAYKHKQWWRSAGAAIKNLLKGNFKELSLRRKVISGKMKDPYDTYEWMDDLHKKYRLKPDYFFLVAEKNKGVDKNILPSSAALQQLIKEHTEKYKTGVHPSWQSGDDLSLLKKEKEIVENISGKTVSISRQHYIRLTLPDTFRRLIDMGITEDYSMGYGSINGFRASVASPFYWYDLEKEEETKLLLYPFCCMDANLFYEQKLTPQQALDEMRYYYQQVKNVNGILITIWHNNFFGTDERFVGWKEMYEQFVQLIMGQTGTVRPD
jgi:hypothetical protein